MALIPDYSPGATLLSPEEIQELLPSYITTQGQLNEFEQANIMRGALWANASRQSILTVKFTRELHRRMFDATWRWAGQYRTSEKNIGCPYWDIPFRVMELLNNTQAIIDSNSMLADEISVRFHHRLVSIHPFPNGNGRHSRLMADTLITRLGNERFSWGSNGNLVSPSITRKRYISALQAADNRDLHPLLVFARS